MALAALLVLVLAIGASLGLSGMGGFLIPPLLVALAGLEPRDAVADALISFVPAGLLGAHLYRRRHALSRRLAAALCLGSLPGIAAGREISLSLDQRDLQRVLAVVVAGSAVALLGLRRREPQTAALLPVERGRGLAVVAAIGGLTAVLTVLVGVGGPLLAVPALALLGVEISAAVGASLLASTVSSAAGAAALLPTAGDLRWPVLAGVVCLELAGIAAGVLLRSRIPAVRLPQLVSASAAAAAVWLFWSTS